MCPKAISGNLGFYEKYSLIGGNPNILKTATRQ